MKRTLRNIVPAKLVWAAVLQETSHTMMLEGVNIPFLYCLRMQSAAESQQFKRRCKSVQQSEQGTNACQKDVISGITSISLQIQIHVYATNSARKISLAILIRHTIHYATYLNRAFHSCSSSSSSSSPSTSKECQSIWVRVRLCYVEDSPDRPVQIPRISLTLRRWRATSQQVTALSS